MKEIRDMPRPLWVGLHWLRMNGRESEIKHMPVAARIGLMSHLELAEEKGLVEVTRSDWTAAVWLTAKGCEWAWWWSWERSGL